MEGVGARLGRSSSRYGTTTVFTGPVRKWKKKWIHITPSSTDNNKHHPSSNGNNNDAASHILLYKWTPIRKTHNHHNNNNNSNTNDDDNSADEEPPRRKMKYIPIAVLEEQNNEAQTDDVENDPIAPDAEPSSKPDMNDVPMEENQVSERIHAVDNKSTVGLSLNLNDRDDGDADGDEEQPNDDDVDEVGE